MIVSRISAFAVRNWQFTLVMFALLAAMGINAFKTIPRAEDPSFPIPFVIVTAVLPGGDPADMEKLVVRPIEDAINGLDDVEIIRSRAEDGLAIITVEFDWSSDAEKKYDDVMREVNVLRPDMPAGLQSLDVNKVRTTLTNVVQVALVSETAPARELEDVARDLKDAIDRMPGVRESKAWGLPAAEIQVAVNFGRLTSMNIPVTAVANAVGAASIDIPGGPIHAGVRRFNVKTTGGYKNLQQIRDTIVGSYNGYVVRISDVAEVSWGQEEASHLAWYNGKRAIFVTANQKDNQNVFEVRNGIYRALDEFEKTLPPDIRLERGFDQSISVAKRLDRLYHDFMIAVALVMITLLPLGPRASLIVMISIPLSLAIGLSMLSFAGFSLNQLSISGFILALGLLVDDSIVVVENIERHLREGKSRLEAAIAATSQISIAVVGCTATLMLAFLPLLFLPEGAGKFTRSLPLAVLFTVMASLFVALTIIPFLASRLLSDKAHPEGNIFLRIVMGGIQKFYRPLLHIALNAPRTTVIAALILCFASFLLIPRIGFSLFPPADSRQFLVQIEAPQGTGMSKTQQAVDYVEAVLESYPQVDWFMSNLGHGNPQIYYNIHSNETRANMAEVFVQLHKFVPGETAQILDSLRARFAQYPGAQIVLRTFENGPPIEAPIAVRIFGPEIPVLKDLATQVTRIIEETPGTRDVVNPVRLDRTDLNLGINTQKAAMFGVPAGEIDRTVRLAIVGENVGAFREADGTQYNIVVRLPLSGHHTLDALNKVYVPTADGRSIPLGLLAEPRLESAPGRIDRYNRERVVTITAFTGTGYNTEKVTNEIFARLAELPRPPGYEFKAGGEIEARKKSFSGLSDAMLIAIFGIMAVLILEVRSFRSTLVVAGVIPLGLFGGIISLWLSGYPMSFTAVIGFIALVGIEIKNSILLVDFTNQLRRTGMPLLEAIEQAGEIRFLPVLLTSATAIGGLLPLALAESGLYSPLAWAIIGGLVSSTFLSRLVTPTMYLLAAPETLPHEAEGGSAAGTPAPAPAPAD